ncbi:alpha/beta hydrolase [Plantactinospora sp. B5E13]|uniref:alpha/beta hydrolase n=1 Tax=unclassified Plantactinospora TaxID=2631981 RepID=UPI00325DD9B8
MRVEGGTEVFQVRSAELGTAATRALPEQVAVLGNARLTLLSQTVPAEWLGRLAGAQQAATAHAGTIATSLRQLAAATTELEGIVTRIQATASGAHRYDDEQARKHQEQGQRVAQAGGVTSDATGTVEGIAGRDADNRTRVRSVLEAAETERARVAAERAALLEQPPRNLAQHDAAVGVLDEELKQLDGRINAYQRMLDSDTKILAFDPAGNGRAIGLVGEIGENTRAVGVLVPGTFSNIENFAKYENLASSFVVPGRASGEVAMVVWMDGALPQSLVSAGTPSYSQELAPRLHDFVNGDLRPMVGDHTRITVIGHSYGGATMGLADAAGMRADHGVHLGSAGMGHGVPEDRVPNDYFVTRYAITSPYDPIQMTQGGVGEGMGLNHGPDPDTYPGVIQIPSGRSAAGEVLTGELAHTGLLEPYSDSWLSIYNIITGDGPVPAPPIRPGR